MPDSTPTLPHLGPDDPPPFTVLNPESRVPLLLVADHAGNRIPAALNDLGLGSDALGLHIAYDIGVDPLARRLAERFEATTVLHNYSRLILDPNRELDDPTSICAISDGIVISGNRDLSAEERVLRAETFFHPYQSSVGRHLDRLERVLGTAPPMIAVHSFTPQMHNGSPRPWHVGVLWGEDRRLAGPLIDALAKDARWVVGDNEPYDARNAHGYTVEHHADRRGAPSAIIEVRQDLIADAQGVALWSEVLGTAIREVLDRG